MSVSEIVQAPARGGSSPAKAWLRALEATAPIAAQPARILPTVIDELGVTYGDAPALLSDRECLTFRDLAGRANRYARWALERGIAKGDVVGLLMPNRPEYLAIWLGISHVGGVVSLLNTGLSGASLAHCIDVALVKHVIVAAELVDRLASAREHLARHLDIWVHGEGGGDLPRIEIENHSGSPLSAAERRSVTIEDRALCIYTSGTTGLPKAANVSHERLMRWSYWFAGLMGTGPDDRMYNCLPLYHSVGGVVAVGAALVNGGSVVIRDRFSAREFWNDVARWDCTLFQYIGELCRYLVNAGQNPHERAHRLRLACGNGLRADVWPEFKRRFAIPDILEFYAATEGNVSLYNVEGKPGAIGRIPSFLAHRFPVALVRFDVEAGTPVRNDDGRCMRCAPGETGEAIGEIRNTAGLRTLFEGYTDNADTERKILRDVFKQGDAWFRTGDLMRRDEQGYFYFVDRIGDTFRWKGENVSTSEVAGVLTKCDGVVEACVYGVEIPKAEGRAGMADIVAADGFDLVRIYQHLAQRLPAYARPLFIRVAPRIAVTATFKHRKPESAGAGFDPADGDGPIYFSDPERKAFVLLDAALYQRIRSGQIRL